MRGATITSLRRRALRREGRHDLAGETPQLLAAAGNGQQNVLDAGALQRLQHGGDLVGRAVERVLLGGAGLVGIGQHVGAGLAGLGIGPSRRGDGAPGIVALAFERGLRVGVVPGDIELARHRDLHRVEGEALGLARPPVDGDALGQRLRRGVLVEDEVEAALSGARDRVRIAGGDPERRVRALHRRRLDHDVLEMEEAAVVREALARGEGARHDVERLLEARLGLLRRDLEALELGVAVALADAEVEAAVAEQVEGGGLLGEQHRIVPGQHHHRGAEPERRGARGERHQQHQGGGGLLPAAEMVLDREARHQAERLGLDVEIEIVAEALAGLGGKSRRIRLGRTEQTETHYAASRPLRNVIRPALPDFLRGRTPISTSRSKFVRNSISRSIEYSRKWPLNMRETSGWLMPRRFPTCTWFSFFALASRYISATICALRKCGPASGGPRSTKMLPLPASTFNARVMAC